MKTESMELHEIKTEYSSMDTSNFSNTSNIKKDPDSNLSSAEFISCSKAHIKKEDPSIDISSESNETYPSNLKSLNEEMDLNPENEENSFASFNETNSTKPLDGNHLEVQSIDISSESDETDLSNMKYFHEVDLNPEYEDSFERLGRIPRKRQKRPKKLSEAEEQILKQQKLKSNHRVRPPCENCRLKCYDRVTPQIREKENEEFWNLIGLVNRRSFFITHVKRTEVKRRCTGSIYKKRNNVFNYYVKDHDGKDIQVCKTFFLTTLGFKPSNDCVLFNALRSVDSEPKEDMRGKIKNQFKMKSRRKAMRQHVESYHPCISHFRRDDVPSKRYLPNDLTIKDMHADFVKKCFAYRTCSYELYRSVLVEMNMCFAKVGMEECEMCETFNKHDPSHDKNNLSPDCDICCKWSFHIKRVSEAKDKYQSHVTEVSCNPDTAYFTADLQKPLVLPRIDSVKEAMFTRRLLVFNQSFVPLGITENNTKPMVFLWHEAIAGRQEEDIISVFYQFFLECRDKKRVVLWLDDSFNQNKNWKFLTFLLYVVNSKDVETECVEVYYFEAGHTCLSTDSFYHQVETSIKRKGKIYDFKDFENAVRQANSKNFLLKSMTPWDFRNFKDQSSPQKLKTLISKPLMNDIRYLKAVRGSYTLKFRMNYYENVDLTELDFLLVKVMKLGFSKPEVSGSFRGIPEDKKRGIIENLVEQMPVSRRSFWYDLPEGDFLDLIDNNG